MKKGEKRPFDEYQIFGLCHFFLPLLRQVSLTNGVSASELDANFDVFL
jgi:hypothetical protein